MVDKLAELEEAKSRLSKESKERFDALNAANDELWEKKCVVDDLMQHTRFNDSILDQFNKARGDLLRTLESPPSAFDQASGCDVIAN